MDILGSGWTVRLIGVSSSTKGWSSMEKTWIILMWIWQWNPLLISQWTSLLMLHSVTDFSDVPSSAQTNTGPNEVIEYSKGKGRETWSSHAPNASLMPSDLDIIDSDWPIHAIKKPKCNYVF